MTASGQDAQGNFYKNYIAQGIVNTQELRQEILNVSAMTQAAAGFGAGGGGGASYTYTIDPGNDYQWGGMFPYPLHPEPVDLEALTEKIVTRYVPGNPLVICVNDDLTPGQMDEISAQLDRLNAEAVIIRGAQAGTGRGHPRPVREECKRIDILAQLAETWERHPDLTLAELLRWWTGVNMTDDEFAAATDVYARKVYE